MRLAEFWLIDTQRFNMSVGTDKNLGLSISIDLGLWGSIGVQLLGVWLRIEWDLRRKR